MAILAEANKDGTKSYFSGKENETFLLEIRWSQQFILLASLNPLALVQRYGTIYSMRHRPTKTHHQQKNAAAVSLARLGSSKGGKARAEKLSPERRSEIAKIASAARMTKISPKRRSEIGRLAISARWGKA
jgi:hypothetical protein